MVTHFKILIFLFILPLTFIGTFAQDADSVIVKVGSSYISVDEFRLRYELIPQTNRFKDLNERKENLLYSLIAEKLWALEAGNNKLDTNDIMQTTFRLVEKMFVRDALYKVEIESRIKISEEELFAAMKKYFTDITVKILYSPDSSEIYNLYHNLNSGAKFDSFYSISKFRIPPVEIKAGEMKREIEDSIYNLNQGEYTAPVQSGTGWIIFSMNEKKERAFTSEDVNSTISKVKKQLEDVKIDSVYKKFMSSFLRDKKIETDGEIFWSITDKIIAALQEKKTGLNIPDTVDVRIEIADILNIEKKLGPDTLKMIFINFESEPLTVKEFLRYFIFEGFYSASVNENIIAAKLNSRIKTLIEQELLAREGFKRGLQNLPEVKQAIKMWRENYLAKIYKNKLLDSVKLSEEEVNNYYNKAGYDTANIVYVNVIEILTDSLEVIEKVLNEIERGKDFKEMASLYTKRKWTKNKGGEFGIFPSSMHGEIGSIAANMEIGEVYGPLATPEGYSIFKLIDKKLNRLLPEKAFEENKDEIIRQLKLKMLSESIIAHTVELANKYGIHINASLLNSIPVKDFNMFAVRYIGFGGRMTAVPFTLQFSEWVEEWMKSLHDVP